jgi:microcystin degradation protein MlrC
MFDDLREDQRERLAETHKAALASIMNLVAPLMDDDSDDDAQDEAREAIYNDALSVEVRGGWHLPGHQDELDEFRILLTTGGPAVQIAGELDGHCEAVNPRLQVQDWFLPWTEFPVSDDEQEAIETYARQFYFGA